MSVTRPPDEPPLLRSQVTDRPGPRRPFRTVPIGAPAELAAAAAALPGLAKRCLAVGAATDLVAFPLVQQAFPWNEAQGLTFAGGALAALVTLAVARGPRAFLAVLARDGLGWLVAFALALSLRGAVMALLVDGGFLAPPLAQPLGVAVSSAVALVAVRLGRGAGAEEGVRWHLVAGGVFVYLVLFRLAYGGVVELLHEEAYYWNYAQHLDIGYYDHPPMVAWLIALGTYLFGSSEWAVRAGALLCGAVTAGYTAALAAEVGGRRRAVGALLLVALLPGFFLSGLIMTPDAPLVACWAAALFHLYRALVRERAGDWYAAGLWIGVGLLSKYTMALLALGVLVHVVSDRRGRAWLRRPQPYVAALLATLLFAPVVAWNAHHTWVSFDYQILRRVRGNFDFDLPDFLGTLMILLTPAGLLTAVAVFRSRRALAPTGRDSEEGRGLRLLLTLAAVPFAVFGGFSLFRNIQFDWTTPLWLGLLPHMAAFVLPEDRLRLPAWAVRPWKVSVAATLMFYATLFYYVGVGIPGLPTAAGLRDFGTGIASVAGEVDRHVRELRDRTGETPTTVCLDTDRLAGWLAFYRVRLTGDRSAIALTTGNQLLGGESGMYRFWHPAAEQRGHVIELVGRSEQEVADARARLGALPLTPVEPLDVRKRGRAFARFWCQGARVPP